MPQSSVPRLTARFDVDSKGNPRFIESGGKNHYRIVLEVEDLPPDLHAVTFELHPSYYDPIQTVPLDRERRVRLSTTTYGDYDLRVILRTRRGEVSFVENLTRAFERGLGSGEANPATMQALAQIASE